MMKQFHIMPIVFNMIRHLVTYHQKNYLKITNIEEDINSKDIIITFFSTRKRSVISVQSVKNIMENEYLINQFDPLDAAKIGTLMANSQFKKIHRNK